MKNTLTFPGDDHTTPRPDAAEVVAVVIGAGTIGLRTATTLAAHGVKVSVFDRHAVPVQATSTVHRALLQSPNARVVGRVDVIGILTSSEPGSVRGVRARLRGLHDAEFFADLVVDATGEQSLFDCWRGRPGFARSEEVDALLEPSGYASPREESPAMLR
jgi:NAD(P)-dependent dehydrogenase (short-subunit alcohol dehydrogenase family)